MKHLCMFICKFTANKYDTIRRDDEVEVASGGPYANHLHLTPESRQITTPSPHHSIFYRPDTLPDAKPTAS